MWRWQRGSLYIRNRVWTIGREKGERANQWPEEKERETVLLISFNFPSICLFIYVSTNGIAPLMATCQRIKTRLFDRYRSHTISPIKIWSTCLIPTWGVHTQTAVLLSVNLVQRFFLSLFEFESRFASFSSISFPHPIAKWNVFLSI